MIRLSNLDRILRVLGLRTLSETLTMIKLKAKPIEICVEHNWENLDETERLLEFLSRVTDNKIFLRYISLKREVGVPLPIIKMSGALANKFLFCGRLSAIFLPIITEAVALSSDAVRPKCPSTDEPPNVSNGWIKLYVVPGIPCILAGTISFDLARCWRSLRLQIINIEDYEELAEKIRSVPAFEFGNRIFLRGAPRSVEKLASRLWEVLEG